MRDKWCARRYEINWPGGLNRGGCQVVATEITSGRFLGLSSSKLWIAVAAVGMSRSASLLLSFLLESSTFPLLPLKLLHGGMLQIGYNGIVIMSEVAVLGEPVGRSVGRWVSSVKRVGCQNRRSSSWKLKRCDVSPVRLANQLAEGKLEEKASHDEVRYIVTSPEKPPGSPISLAGSRPYT